MVFPLQRSTCIVLLSKNICPKFHHSMFFNKLSQTASSSIDSEELKKFTSDIDEWWHGPKLELLRASNSIRVPFIRDGILATSGCTKKKARPLEGYTILDVGCGGGLLSEPLARLGANVTGLDPVPQNISIATSHAEKDVGIKNNIKYECDTIENILKLNVKYDAVVCSEVVEHVNNVEDFVSNCIEATKENGSLFFTTINQTRMSYLMSILMAEYVLHLVPRGTHDWKKFVKPEELCNIIESKNCRVVSVEGIMYNPITKKFSWCPSSINWYAVHAIKD